MADRRQPCSRLQCPAMCGRSSLPRRLNWPSAAAALARRVRLAGSSTGSEAHLDPIARGWQSLAEGGQAASLVPQAVGDGAGKAEQLGAGRRQVDRVVVAGGTGIAPADVGGRLPVVDRLQRQRLLLGFRRNFAGHLDAAAEHLLSPTQSRPSWSSRRVTMLKVAPLSCGCRFSTATLTVNGPRPPSARSTSMRFSRWTRPSSGKGSACR